MPVYEDKKTKTWYAIFWYKTYDGRRKQKMKRGFKRQKDAKAYERDFLARMEGTPDMTFGHLFEAYLEDATHRLKESTVHWRTNRVKTKVLPFFKDLPVNKITPATIRSWQNDLLSHRQKNGKPYAKTYLKTINDDLSIVLNFAVRFFNLKENPMDKAGSIGRKKADEMEFWTIAEFDQAMTYFDLSKPRHFQYYAAFMVLFHSGMRQGELLALTLNDFDFENKEVSITKTYTRINKKDIITTPKKENSVRTINLPDIVLDTILEYVNLLVYYEPDTRLFTMYKGSYNTNLTKAAEKTGVKKIRLHDLRHSHTSFLINLGYDPLFVKERLGHKNIDTTLDTYGHLYPDKNIEANNKINKMLSERYQSEEKDPTK